MIYLNVWVWEFYIQLSIYLIVCLFLLEYHGSTHFDFKLFWMFLNWFGLIAFNIAHLIFLFFIILFFCSLPSIFYKSLPFKIFFLVLLSFFYLFVLFLSMINHSFFSNIQSNLCLNRLSALIFYFNLVIVQ